MVGKKRSQRCAGDPAYAPDGSQPVLPGSTRRDGERLARNLVGHNPVERICSLRKHGAAHVGEDTLNTSILTMHVLDRNVARHEGGRFDRGRSLIVGLAFFGCVTPQAIAGDSSGQVASLTVLGHPHNVVHFQIGQPGNHNNKPACSTWGEEWALSLATEGGRAQYAMLLSAVMSGRSVNVAGTNACIAWGDRETPESITTY